MRLVGDADGYIKVMWLEVSSIQMPNATVYARQVAGWIALAGVVLLLGGLIFLERRRTTVNT